MLVFSKMGSQYGKLALNFKCLFEKRMFEVIECLMYGTKIILRILWYLVNKLTFLAFPINVLQNFSYSIHITNSFNLCVLFLTL